MKEYLIKYLWQWPNEQPIEMIGRFTEERWKQFQKQPHPQRRDITISEVSRQLQEPNNHGVN